MSETDIAKVNSLIRAVSADSARVKFGAVKALRSLSESNPTAVYPHFEFILDLLSSENSVLRWNAMLLMGNLATVDQAGRIDRILRDFLRPIAGPRLIDAANTIRGSVGIALAKPHLAERIATAILGVEQANYQTPECRNVAIGHALQALDLIAPVLKDRTAVEAFVVRQMNNQRAGTRRKAERLRRKWHIGAAAIA